MARRTLTVVVTILATIGLVAQLVDAPEPGVASQPAYAQTTLPPLPAGWPGKLELGMANEPGGVARLRATAPFAFRYQYLAGGVNTGHGWATWDPDGNYVTSYIDESVNNSTVPVFSYYMLLQSSPATGANEGTKLFNNLQNAATMAAYYDDLKLFFQKAHAFPSKLVVLHVEPDLWGYMQQRGTTDNATAISASVSSSGVADLAGLPNNLSGFARAIVKLRDTYAQNVVLGYAMSIWGTNVDISIDDPSDTQVDALATRAGSFYLSLNANFDVTFGEFSDRDSEFKIHEWGAGPEAWWDANDFRRHARFNARFMSVAQKRMVLWQIPYGNTRMRAMNDTSGHYQDNRVEWLLDDPARTHLNEYVNAGVIAFLFGSGAEGATDASDAMGDGVTNPAPINGNTLTSISADDDGGFFRQKAAAYYSTGSITLPGGSVGPTPTQAPSCSPRPPVRVTTASGGTGRLQTQITATTTAGAPNNRLVELRFGSATNAWIDVRAIVGSTGNVTVALTDRPQSVSFTVRRRTAGRAMTVPLVVVDDCGAWSTFVGSGPTTP